MLRTLDDSSVDAVVTDPPYGLSFMGKRWDYDVPSVGVWSECLRVLKPGGHLLAFAGTRTQHRMAVRIEDAGFEIRDMIAWVYGSGFPKSLDVSKAIDKAAGAEREKVLVPTKPGNTRGERGISYAGESFSGFTDISEPVTEAAQQWQGWGTALKPALEPITVARKPLVGTVAENVLAHGTGALNIDGCRVGAEDGYTENAVTQGINTARTSYAPAGVRRTFAPSSQGRWPANLIHDGSEEPTALLGEAARFFYCASFDTEEQIIRRAKSILHTWNPALASTVDNSSILPRSRVDSVLSDAATWANLAGSLSSEWPERTTSATPTESRRLAEIVIAAILSIGDGCSPAWLRGKRFQTSAHVSDAARCGLTDTTTITISRWKSDGSADPVMFRVTPPSTGLGGAGSPSRFAYCPKASKADRDDGVAGVAGVAGVGALRDGGRPSMPRKNHHPTVKPTDLMRYLCRLVTPPSGVVLDPFMGSGSTGKAAVAEGFRFIGIEREAEYVEIARARIGQPTETLFEVSA